jgi:hypothetical protein
MLDRLLDRVLFGLVRRSSGRAIAAVALVLYPGIGVLLPLALSWSPAYLVAANITAVCLAASVTLAWFGLQVQLLNRRHLVEWTTDLRLLDSEEFEWLVGELFRRDGWTIEETGRRDAPDGNVDLRLRRGDERRIVQCKRWTTQLVGVDLIRTFAGTLLREGLTGRDGVFVTLTAFGSQAEAEARSMGMTLVDNRALYAQAERARRTEPCPKCQAPMVLDRSSRGWWFRCVAPGCQGKHDLGKEPARAVELLLLDR